MRSFLKVSILAVALAGFSQLAAAQNAGALVGAWQRFSMKDSTGTAVDPVPPAAFVVFTADGFYSQTAIPAGRPKLAKALAEHTKEELLARVDGSEARHGRYTVAGNVLTRTYIASLNPNNEGSPPQVQQFRIDGDVLILTSTRPGNMGEVRFRRAK